MVLVRKWFFATQHRRSNVHCMPNWLEWYNTVGVDGGALILINACPFESNENSMDAVAVVSLDDGAGLVVPGLFLGLVLPQ